MVCHGRQIKSVRMSGVCTEHRASCLGAACKSPPPPPPPPKSPPKAMSVVNFKKIAGRGCRQFFFHPAVFLKIFFLAHGLHGHVVQPDFLITFNRAACRVRGRRGCKRPRRPWTGQAPLALRESGKMQPAIVLFGTAGTVGMLADRGGVLFN